MVDRKKRARAKVDQVDWQKGALSDPEDSSQNKAIRRKTKRSSFWRSLSKSPRRRKESSRSRERSGSESNSDNQGAGGGGGTGIMGLLGRRSKSAPSSPATSPRRRNHHSSGPDTIVPTSISAPSSPSPSPHGNHIDASDHHPDNNSSKGGSQNKNNKKKKAGKRKKTPKKPPTRRSKSLPPTSSKKGSLKGGSEAAKETDIIRGKGQSRQRNMASKHSAKQNHGKGGR